MRQAGRVVLKLCVTPLGLPVVPEVKAMRMTSFAPMGWGTRGGQRTGVSEYPVQRGHIGIVTASEDANGLEVGKARPQLANHRYIVEAPECRRADKGSALGKAQDVLYLPAPEVGTDLVGDRSDPFQREEDVGELRSSSVAG